MKPLTLSLLLIPCLAACNRGAEPQAPASEGPASEAPQEETASVPEGAGRDLAAINVCELISAEVVAAAAKAESAGPPEPTDPGFDGKGCRYQYRSAAGGLTRYTDISLHPPDDFRFQRNMQTFKKIDLPGLGDAAFWGDRSDQVDVYVLKRGDVSVHVRALGQELEPAQAIAAAVLERL